MHAAYASCDVALNTSFSEGLSNSLLEAIAAGRPFLASDIPGNRHPFLQEEDGEPAGCYFDPLDIEDFVRKAVWLIDNERIRKSLSDGAFKISRKMAKPDEEADALIAAYTQALSSSPGCPVREHLK
jgi:L-malate glycosyltransferase